MNGLLKPLCNNWLCRTLCSTVGQKLLMGATGLLLCGFLVVHLAGNTLMFQGAEHYNNYAQKLHENELLPIAEVGLFLLFVTHIVLAFSTTRSNTKARAVSYEMKESKQKWISLFPAHDFMMASGIVVLAFLILHISDMRMGEFEMRLKIPESELEMSAHDRPYAQAIRVLKDPISAIVYIFGSLALGFHLTHGFQSAFQTLGLNHPKYTPFIKKFGILFAILIGLGFASLPIWFFAAMKS